LSDYWINFWNNNELIHNVNPQSQIGRTLNKKPITNKEWQKVIDFLSNEIQLNKNHDILDLCAGNGLISIPFSKKCKSVASIDYSKKLIDEINRNKKQNVTTLIQDIRKLKFKKDRFDKVIFYFSIQHFSYKETIEILMNIHRWLKKGGCVYIGDIPNLNQIWKFYNTTERRTEYFHSIIKSVPIIGTWFQPQFFTNAADLIGYKKSKIITQPSNFLNAHYRFDFIAYK